MGAGKRNRRIVIQKKTVTHDSYNQPIETWTDTYTIWAEVITTGGGEFYAAQKVNSQTQVVFNVRYTKSIGELDRVKYDGKIFEILSADDKDGGRMETQISAKEVT